ncbi:MAG: hypothetical protein ACLFOY_07850 [Desulfatibacillaceae bacterium]
MFGWPKREAGQRWGWLGGCLGASLWILVMAVLFLYLGSVPLGALYLALWAAAVAAAYFLRPWARPDTRVRWLYLVTAFVIIVPAALMVAGLHPFDTGEKAPPVVFVAILPIFIPVLTFGKKTWRDLVGG